MTSQKTNTCNFRCAEPQDVADLLHVEQSCFSSDCLSKRSFRHHVQSQTSVLLLAENEIGDIKKTVGYGLVFCHTGTQLARLYSLAILPDARGGGIARELLLNLEAMAADKGRHAMRLEVAEHNEAAIKLYQSLGYKVFGKHLAYYEDGGNALRMEKPLLANL